MKTIFKSISLIALVAGLASCNNKAEFETGGADAFVAFSGSKYTVKEDAGSIKIPVVLTTMSNKEFTTTVTFKITGGDAVEGTDYTMPNKTGVLTVSNNPEKCDSIEVRPVDMSGTLTKNTTIMFSLESVVEDGIVLGGTKTCSLTIIDIDGGINLLVGNWIGAGIKSSKNDVELDWTIETCDGDEDYPDANLKIVAGSTFKDPMGNTWESQVDIFAFFDDSKSEFQIYPGQVFDAGNFGDDVGVLYVSLDLKSTLQGGEDPVCFLVNDGTMTLKDETYFALYDDSGFSGYTCGTMSANAELRKND